MSKTSAAHRNEAKLRTAHNLAGISPTKGHTAHHCYKGHLDNSKEQI